MQGTQIIGDFGVVASTHWLGTAAGMAMLERGGNAFDAAVATGFALQIVEPHLNGPGGEVPAIFYCAREERVRVLCGQGTAPEGLSIAHVRDTLDLSSVPGTGLLPAVVPGAFGGWLRLLADYGTLPLAMVLEPAIGYARNGFPAIPRLVAALAESAPMFAAHWPSSHAVWTAGGVPAIAHGRMASPAIADTYERILNEAQAGGGSREAVIERAIAVFYQGFVAEAIGQFVRDTPAMDSSGTPHKGVLTADDMARWQPRYEAAATHLYNGHLVHKTGPWGQGPVMLQTLALLEGFDLGAMDPMGPDYVHLVIEAMKLAFADREIHYGDPDFVDVPLARLLDPGYAAERRGLIDMDAASSELRPGLMDAQGAERLAFLLESAGREAAAGMGAGAGAGEPTFSQLPRDGEPTFAKAPGDTVHFDIADRWGNVVSATPSGGWLQSSPVVPALGFPLTTRGQMFWLDAIMPAALAPGRRPRTTLTPTLVTREGRPVMALGTPGGDQQDQWSLQMLLNAVHFGATMAEAADAPLAHTEHFPSSFYPRPMKPGHLAIESRFPETTIAELERRGHRIERKGAWDLGRLCGVGARPDGFWSAGATRRNGQCYAAGR